MRRVLLDEHLPRRLRKLLPGFVVETVADAGWSGKKNGELLRLAADIFDVLVTADRSIPHQQPLASITIGVVLLRVPTTKIEDIEPLLPRLLEALASVQPHDLVVVE